MRESVWADAARDDYLSALAYLTPRNPTAARRLNTLIHETGTALAETPTGRRGRVSGTYEKVLQHYPYIIAYALDPQPASEERLVILRVIHTSRDWQVESWPEG